MKWKLDLINQLALVLTAIGIYNTCINVLSVYLNINKYTVILCTFKR